jgi:CBS domain-containing protein
MENSNNSENGPVQDTEFKRFATKRIVVVTLLAVVVLWVVTAVLGLFDKPSEVQIAHKAERPVEHVSPPTKAHPEAAHKQVKTATHKAVEGQAHPDEKTAGSIMSADFIALDKDLTAGEAIAYLKKEHPDITRPFYLFVVDGHENLLGMVSLKQLMFAASESTLGNFMTTDIMSVNTDTDTEAVKEQMTEHHLKVVPVIDKHQKLVGVVKSDQIIHLAQKEAPETAAHAPAPAHTATKKKAEHPSPPLHEAPAAKHKAPTHAKPAAKHAAPTHEAPAAAKHAAPTHGAPHVAEEAPKAKGVAFVEATIKPLDYELTERFWGWRPNDILDFTDNVNSFQLGVLEVTRRTVVSLTERISRTGSTAAFDANLENAMNWFMVKSNRYWFPSPESKYKAGLDELRTYKEKLEIGEGNFHTRTDNLIPLLMAYEDLLGSCEENLVKAEEDDGSPVSFFQADNYFFYAQGVASAMGTILESVHKDFLITVESRRGAEVLHHAIVSCHHAAEIHPWMITNSSLSGVLANHRANLAAPMSHARFYINVLIKTLST